MVWCVSLESGRVSTYRRPRRHGLTQHKIWRADEESEGLGEHTSGWTTSGGQVKSTLHTRTVLSSATVAIEVFPT